MSFLTNSGVGRDTICSKDGGFKVAGSVPTGNLTGLTNRIGWTPECVLSVVMGVSGLLAGLESRRAATVLGLLLFLGGFPSEDKIKDEGLTTLFLNVLEFLSLSVSWGVVLILVSKLSKFVFSGVNTSGGENSHLSSLRNAWEECIGVDGGVFSPSFKNSSCLSGDGSIGIKGSLSLKNTVLLFSLSNSILLYSLSLLYTLHCCQSFLWGSL